jgi:hypothetical protein
MPNHDFVTNGFLALTAVGLVLLCSSLLAIAFGWQGPAARQQKAATGSDDGDGSCNLNYAPSKTEEASHTPADFDAASR